MADSAMTGEAGANRTFRSIFGDQQDAPKHSDELELEQSDSITSDAVAAAAAATAMDDDDEAMWSDEPPLDGHNAAEDNNGASLQFAERKSMEEWADDDEEEENWKEALQDRVNQLELAFQHNNDSAAAESRRRLEEQQRQLQLLSADQETQHEVCFTASGGDSERPRQATRHKMQRTSSSHACITGENAASSSSTRSSRLWNFQRKVVAAPRTGSHVPDPHKRSTSVDFVARNIQTVEQHRKRSSSMSGASNRTDSPRNSLSRKNSMDSNRNHLVRSNSSILRGTKAAAATTRTSGPATTAVFNLSDTEAIRRFVLDDVKHMSMERLVNDAQRLHFLEDFYQSHQGSRSAASVTSSTVVAPPLSPSSSPAMSTS